MRASADSGRVSLPKYLPFLKQTKQRLQTFFRGVSLAFFNEFLLPLLKIHRLYASLPLLMFVRCGCGAAALHRLSVRSRYANFSFRLPCPADIFFKQRKKRAWGFFSAERGACGGARAIAEERKNGENESHGVLARSTSQPIQIDCEIA